MQTKMITAAATAFLWSATCSFAIDAGVGGVGVSAGDGGVSAGVGGASVGVGVGDGGSVGAGASVGGTSAGVSVGGSSSGNASTGGGSSSGADAGAGGGTSSGTSGSAGGSGSGASGSSAGSSGSSGTSGADSASAPATEAVRAERNAGGEIGLPAKLRPVGQGGILWRLQASAPVPTIAGASRIVVDACRETVVEAAQPYGLVEATVVSYGQVIRLTDGGYHAPVFMRIVYERQGGYEMRQAPILCEFDQAGVVSGLSDAAG